MNKLQETLNEIDVLKEKLNAIRPLPAEAVKKIQEALDIEYTYESNRIEGNTLTLQETALVVNEGITIAGKSMREHLEAVNHAEAVDYIKEIASGDIKITEQTIKHIHALVLHGIDKEYAGRYRNVPVLISGSRYTPPQPYLIEPQMEAFLAGYEQMEKGNKHPVIIAAYLHDELVRIHPFIDGNGRTSRLLMNLYLLSKGYVIASLKGDNEEKRKYYITLEKSHTEHDPTDFYILVASAEKDSIQRYIDILH